MARHAFSPTPLVDSKTSTQTSLSSRGSLARRRSPSGSPAEPRLGSSTRMLRRVILDPRRKAATIEDHSPYRGPSQLKDDVSSRCGFLPSDQSYDKTGDSSVCWKSPEGVETWLWDVELPLEIFGRSLLLLVEASPTPFFQSFPHILDVVKPRPCPSCLPQGRAQGLLHRAWTDL